ncbi:DNA polymerase-3 subunit beta [Anaerosphaera aminiphila DSM 21120]|uniref:Beta sliding clamp n=1 Tax=Anaerosphaera aminiphila DSM 21120 TaxID=1120995 RepID=A0A1M5SD23_9FIRM|nr:DNA polymerase III subunit beta [Anaerosphaera aminiphila]SHH36371.1 DNA polymerase-3 subunit beta [Anaerosphaera aminiphila DSM 21120]
MKFKINKRDLSKHISIVQKAISTRTTMQILEGILLKAKDNKLTLIASDTEITVNTSVSAIVIEEGEIVINSRLFGDIIRKLPDDTIHIEVLNSNMNIKCLNSEFNIQCQPSDEYPDLPKIDEIVNVKLKGFEFKEAIRKTSFAVSYDETRVAFTGVLMDIKENEINFVALDGFRMALKKIIINSTESVSSIVPARSLNELIKIIEDDSQLNISIGKNSMKFDFQDTTFYTTLLSGEFFKYDGLIRENHSTVVEIAKNIFQDALERASLLAKEDKANLVKLNVKENEIEITSNSEIGNVEEIVSSKVDGEPLKIAFNSKYLLEGIKIIDSEKISLNFTDSINPCIIKEDDENYIYLVLPVRLAN